MEIYSMMCPLLLRLRDLRLCSLAWSLAVGPSKCLTLLMSEEAALYRDNVNYVVAVPSCSTIASIPTLSPHC